MPIRIGADVGGTFTDVIISDAEGRVWARKVPSTPPAFEKAVLQAVQHLLEEIGVPGEAACEVAHGSTIATNAVLEHRGARTALITTKGFRDVLELRRIRAPQMYDLFFEKPKELVERHLRLEVRERVSAAGEVLVPLDKGDLQAAANSLQKFSTESVAVCFLHSYAFPEHELRAGEILKGLLPQLEISLSCQVLRERREYERTATTAINAYVRPVMRRYLGAMRQGLTEMGIRAPLLIMQSSGGLTSERDAAERPVFVLESGPAAGVLASLVRGRGLGLQNILTLDMGGTTAKASLIEGGRIAYSSEYEVGASLSIGNRLVGGGGELIRAPSIDVAEVGAGGGSIAFLDSAGGLHVGPRSAGAVPGPVCYGRGGTQPTLTDANVVLGYIRPGELANGEIRIDLDAARHAVRDTIAKPLGLDLLSAAEGIHKIANSSAMRALRAVSTQRGRDPRDFTLMAYGGSGPVHAVGLARELGITRVVVPPLPGLFSAVGLLSSGIQHHDVRSCFLPLTEAHRGALERFRAELQHDVLGQFQREGFSAPEVNLQWSLDIRFEGQSSEVRIGVREDVFSGAGVVFARTAFQSEYERLYGHRSDPDHPIEVVAVRVIGNAASTAPQLALHSAATHSTSSRSRSVWFGQDCGTVDVPVVTRADLFRSAEGPMVIDEYDSTTVVPPGVRARLGEQHDIVLELCNA